MMIIIIIIVINNINNKNENININQFIRLKKMLFKVMLKST